MFLVLLKMCLLKCIKKCTNCSSNASCFGKLESKTVLFNILWFITSGDITVWGNFVHYVHSWQWYNESVSPKLFIQTLFIIGESCQKNALNKFENWGLHGLREPGKKNPRHISWKLTFKDFFLLCLRSCINCGLKS